MKIRVEYESNNINQAPISMEVEVPDEDCVLMIEADYKNRLASATDKQSVKRREIQEIFDEDYNKPLYNSWHKERRHCGTIKTPFRKDDEDEDFGDGLDTIPDYSEEEARQRLYEYEDVCYKVRRALASKPEWAEMFISIRINGMAIKDYARLIGDSDNNITQKLKRAEKKLKEIFENRQI